MRSEEVVQLRWERQRGALLRELAKKYGLSESYVSRIVKGEYYPNIGGPIADSRPKNQCIRGHEYTPDNTVIKHGRRNCRRCKNELSNVSRRRKRAEARAARDGERQA